MGLRSAVAINVATMVGAGPFITLPLVVAALHGSVSAVPWVLGAVIALCDGLVWAELAARFPRSGGTYTYLREAFGPHGPGRFAAFLFVWQFLFWAPLVIASGYIGFAQYAAYVVPAIAGFVPTHLVAVGIGIVTLAALYRPIPQIARTALVLGAVALATLLAVAFAGLGHPYAPLTRTLTMTTSIGIGVVALGGALVNTLYDYGGYGDVCALGDEVIAPARIIPRAILLSVLFVGAAYVLLNLGVAAAIAPHDIAGSTAIASLVAERAFGNGFAIVVTLAVMVTAFGSTYGLLLAASRIPYAAARDGDFLPAFARLHPTARFPARSLVAIGVLALPASLLPLDAVINALTAGIVLIQGAGQIVGLALARRARPDAAFRVPLYPLPPLIALAGWLFLFQATGTTAIAFGLGTLAAGALVFLVRAARTRSWPFAATLAGAIALACARVPAPAAAAAPSFGHAAIVQRDGDPVLLVDGRPFFFWGGAFFYERIAPSRWRDAMTAMRGLGANTLDLYVPWNWHELADGEFDFDGHSDPRRNLREVLRLGAELGFHFIVRPGPVIRNEWRNGGYPAWLLTRPEYDMPLHDVLEGRYPATATLQNAHSDDAAAEWMRNTTHLQYASRWLHRALAEFRPYADRVIAVQLDDDQGAYIDNQTYPAPHLHAYLGWLERQVRDEIGPVTPTFINTYQMRVPASSPVWTMGNWYQSDAYTVGTHDRIDLDFSTLLLATNRRGPLAQSEFQAGWLAGPEDPQPRPADPRNTALALGELLALGVHGVIDFPMQDTLAEPGWEAPFANAAYTWDAALRYDAGRSDRFAPTAEFGSLIAALGPMLAATHRAATIALAYAEPPPRADSLPPAGADAIVAVMRTELAQCVASGLVCDILDVRADARRARRYDAVVVPPAVAAAAPSSLAAVRAAVYGTATRIVAAVPSAGGPGVTELRSAAGTLILAANWGDRTTTVRYRDTSIVLAPHATTARVRDLALAALGARGEARRVSSDDCAVSAPASGTAGTVKLVLGSTNGCSLRVRLGRTVRVVHVRAGQAVSLPDLSPPKSVIPTFTTTAAPPRDTARLAPALAVAVDDGGPLFEDEALVRERVALHDTGRRDVVLVNGRLRVIVDPNAGARAFTLQARRAAGWSANAFDATGGWRDDVSTPAPPSARDYIARYTHQYPAGTSNRAYDVDVLRSGTCAAVRLSYTMPDATPPGVRFERILRLAPRSSRVVVDERIVVPDASEQRAVLRTSSPALMPGRAIAAADGTIEGLRDGWAFVVAWRPDDVEQASWTPYRSTGTLALTLAPGWRRTTYAYAPARDEAAAHAFAEAERAWVAANPAPTSEDGEVAKRYTQSPQKRPSESSCGFESHLPQ